MLGVMRRETEEVAEGEGGVKEKGSFEGCGELGVMSIAWRRRRCICDRL